MYVCCAGIALDGCTRYARPGCRYVLRCCWSSEEKYVSPRVIVAPVDVDGDAGAPGAPTEPPAALWVSVTEKLPRELFLQIKAAVAEMAPAKKGKKGKKKGKKKK